MSTPPDIGNLKKVPLRKLWPNEAGDFTPWLADNLERLSSGLGINLVLIGEEEHVGPFRADTVCKNKADDSIVLIENQLDSSDHGHLGQLLTYAADKKAKYAVWIAQHFTKEHRAAPNYLNGFSDDSMHFFGVEIEVWRIGQSDYAPKFVVISQPKDWKKIAIEMGKQELTKTQRLQLQFWTELKEELARKKSPVVALKEGPRNYLHFSLDRSQFGLYASTNSRKHNQSVGFWVEGKNQTAYFQLLHANRATIEDRIGSPITWAKGWGFYTIRSNVDPLDENQWNDIKTWFIEKIEAFHLCLLPMALELDPANYVPVEGDD